MRYSPFIVLILVSCVLSCSKDEPSIPVDTIPELNNGLLVLNEGLFQQNNSRLSYIDLTSNVVENQFFEAKTGRPLGDTGNDIARYGGKIYCVVNVSNTVEVLDAHSGKSLQQISMVADGVAKQPRSVVFANGKAFVSCFDGYVDVIDTSQLTVVQRIKVGRNPDQMAVAAGKVFVSNSGGLDFPNVDTTLSVINPVSFTESKITVGPNPGKLVSMSENELFVLVRGNGSGQNEAVLKSVNPQSESLIGAFAFDLLNFCKFGSDALVVRQNASNEIEVVKMDNASGLLESSPYMNVNSINTLYGIDYHEAWNKIIVFDAQEYVNTGKVLLFSESGVFESSFDVALNPSAYVWFE